MELKLQTEIGELTGIFETYPINCYQNTVVAWFKERTNIIVQADDIHEAIKELKISLHVVLDYEKRNKIKYVTCSEEELFYNEGK